MATAERPPVTRERILDTALSLADAEGLSAVSMRRVATELGVEAMSLYHHVANKDALLDGLVERVASEALDESMAAAARQGAASDDWRAAVRTRSLAARRVMLRHPWAPALITSRSVIPLQVQSMFEAVLGAMIEGGVSYRTAHRGLHALSSMVLGFVQEPFSSPEGGPQMEGVEMSDDLVAQFAEHFPYTAAMVGAELHSDDEATLGWCDSQTEFEFTLGLLLDGLERAAKAGE
ncbi:TetR/AcrR family transcriptional regulator C-terminal domain-containing protein [Microcella sp.]|uniref:TetR/AcrR family transcriptional regulator n=1 Tax=Microcella sp. TaxID=1913979 RepID=UPI00261DF55B|nr:TetR/AcrR family transcriptional regulator C-terminal domain-containing protein [Microcella sp.]